MGFRCPNIYAHRIILIELVLGWVEWMGILCDSSIISLYSSQKAKPGPSLEKAQQVCDIRQYNIVFLSQNNFMIMQDLSSKALLMGSSVFVFFCKKIKTLL